jgi:hypothetical protein
MQYKGPNFSHPLMVKSPSCHVFTTINIMNATVGLTACHSVHSVRKIAMNTRQLHSSTFIPTRFITNPYQ